MDEGGVGFGELVAEDVLGFDPLGVGDGEELEVAADVLADKGVEPHVGVGIFVFDSGKLAQGADDEGDFFTDFADGTALGGFAVVALAAGELVVAGEDGVVLAPADEHVRVRGVEDDGDADVDEFFGGCAHAGNDRRPGPGLVLYVLDALDIEAGEVFGDAGGAGHEGVAVGGFAGDVAFDGFALFAVGGGPLGHAEPLHALDAPGAVFVIFGEVVEVAGLGLHGAEDFFLLLPGEPGGHEVFVVLGFEGVDFDFIGEEVFGVVTLVVADGLGHDGHAGVLIGDVGAVGPEAVAEDEGGAHVGFGLGFGGGVFLGVGAVAEGGFVGNAADALEHFSDVEIDDGGHGFDVVEVEVAFVAGVGGGDDLFDHGFEAGVFFGFGHALALFNEGFGFEAFLGELEGVGVEAGSAGAAGRHAGDDAGIEGEFDDFEFAGVGGGAGGFADGLAGEEDPGDDDDDGDEDEAGDDETDEHAGFGIVFHRNTRKENAVGVYLGCGAVGVKCAGGGLAYAGDSLIAWVRGLA